MDARNRPLATQSGRQSKPRCVLVAYLLPITYYYVPSARPAQSQQGVALLNESLPMLATLIRWRR